jgi:hypothetical protein
LIAKVPEMILSIGQLVRYSADFINRMGCPQLANLIGRIDAVYGDMVGVQWETGFATGGSFACFQVHSPLVDSVVNAVKAERLAKVRRDSLIDQIVKGVQHANAARRGI